LLYFETPRLWPRYPFLPVIRQLADSAVPECGLLYDARGASGIFGYSSTVFLVNLALVPATEAEFLALPKSVYDTFEDLADDGWVVD